MISARNVSKWYGRVRAVDHVSFEIPKGQIVGLLGPNGAGKTTTIRITTGFLPPSEGSVSVCGHDVVADSIPARRSIGYLPESAPLYPEMAVRGYLDFRARLYGLRRRQRRAAVAAAMDRCALADVRDRRIGHLSKGYRQRVGLAAALLHDPPVLILDEPTTGLDPSQIREARRLIRELAHNRTVLVSSHILPEVEATCDRVIIIAGGRIRADAPTRALVADPLSPYVVEIKAGAGREADGAAGVLRRVAGVADVRFRDDDADGPWRCALVFPAPRADDLREAIARAAAAAGLSVRELHRPAPSLEQVFLRIIDDGAATVNGSPTP
jgi:ABC-2 type transport system ATP-binding protein